MPLSRVLTVIVVGVSFSAWTMVVDAAPVVTERREESISPASGFVSVPLDERANHLVEDVSLPAGICVDGVPFALAGGPSANNVLMNDLGWQGWKEDSPAFYDPYDCMPDEDPNRWVIHVPIADYSAVHLLAYAERDPAFSNVVTFRVGSLGRGGRMDQVFYRDVWAAVPRAGDNAPGRVSIGKGLHDLFYVRVPLGKAIAQDLVDRKTVDVDVTKELRLAIRRPDPCRFRVRPLGLPCGVHVLAMTFERSPIQMEVTSEEVGNIFNEPQIPTFQVKLDAIVRTDSEGRLIRPKRCRIEAVATDYYGNQTPSQTEVALASPDATEPVLVDIPMRVPNRGYHDLEVRLEVGQHVLLTRQTSFALLPHDTREYRAEAPFGVRDRCGAHFTPQAAVIRGPLYVKAGLRYAFEAEALDGYGVVEGNDTCVKSGKAVEDLAARIRKAGDRANPERLLIFHEDHLGRDHHYRTPTFFTRWAPYRLNENEQSGLDQMMSAAGAAAGAIGQSLPGTEIYFGNGSPLLLEAFLRRNFPAELLGSRGCEPCSFARMPEAQPFDYNAVNAVMWMDRRMLDGYGYIDTPTRVCQEICFPSTNPGNLSERTQALYLVRHLMHMLAWRMPVIRPCWLTDSGSTYYFGNWGSAGLCRAKPEVNPKPAYVAYATTTLLLDGATFSRAVPTGSPVVYAVEFKKKDGSFVTCMWTIRGRRTAWCQGLTAAKATLTDTMANEDKVTVADGTGAIPVSPSPVFLTTSNATSRIECGPPRYADHPGQDSFIISSLGAMDEWRIEKRRSVELETYNYTEPRRVGNFEYREVDEFDGKKNVLQVRPQLPVPGSEYLPMYSVLTHRDGVEIPAEPTEIGLMVNGNGGWGRIIFELEDAAGERWVSIGGEIHGEQPPRWLAEHLGNQAEGMDSTGLCAPNTNDLWGDSYINFEGWRYLRFPMPGHYPGEGYHWPRTSQWRHQGGDGVVQYPLRFKRLIITIPEKAVYLTDYRAVERQEIYLKDLMVTYRPPEVAFAPE